MNFKSSLQKIASSIAILGTVSLSSFSALSPVKAVDFGQQEVDQSKFIAIAAPYRGGQRYQLYIFEQISSTQRCWSEIGSNPTGVDLLLLNFDFTDICGRSSDTNGYSIREAGKDMGWMYELSIVKRGNDLVLLGTPNVKGNAIPMEIGRSNGMTNGFVKINLNPGWRFSKRTYQGNTLGHVYLTTDTSQTPAQANANY
jgi:N-acetylmuramoyl-L-alanine amidase